MANRSKREGKESAAERFLSSFGMTGKCRIKFKIRSEIKREGWQHEGCRYRSGKYENGKI